MAGPASFMDRDHRIGAGHGDCVAAGDDLDETADDGRVHGVVVPGDAHVVVTGQSDRGAPPGQRCHRWQRVHRLPVGLDPLVRGRSPRTVCGGCWPAAPTPVAGC